MKLLNVHSGNRIQLEEQFTARVTVSATDDGLGALSELAFTGPNGELGPIVQEDFAFLPGTTSELISELRPSGGPQLPSPSSLLDQSAAAVRGARGGVRLAGDPPATAALDAVIQDLAASAIPFNRPPRRQAHPVASGTPWMPPPSSPGPTGMCSDSPR